MSANFWFLFHFQAPNCCPHTQFPPPPSVPGRLDMPVFYLRAYVSPVFRWLPICTSIYIERHPNEICFAFHGAGLPAHCIPCVFDNCGKPGPVGTVMQMAQAKVLLYTSFSIFSCFFLSRSQLTLRSLYLSALSPPKKAPLGRRPSFIPFRCRKDRLGCPKYPLSA